MSQLPAAKKVLVIEDDAAISGMLEVRLSSVGYEVLVAGDGEAGLIGCVEFRPDLILLDVNLPKIDGFSVAKRLKGADALKNVPIIFLTARDRPGDMIEGIQAGAKHYVTKPFDMDQLLKKVRKLVA